MQVKKKKEGAQPVSLAQSDKEHQYSDIKISLTMNPYYDLTRTSKLRKTTVIHRRR